MATVCGSRRIAALELRDFRRHRGGEQQRLTLDGQTGDDPLDIGQEAHVKHLIRFVEDKNLHAVEACRAGADMVEQPAGGRNNHFDAGSQCAFLRNRRRASDNESRSQTRPHGQAAVNKVDLLGEFTGRSQDQRTDIAAITRYKMVKHRQEERCSLAGARLGGGNEVASCQYFRYGPCLYGSRSEEAARLDVLKERGMETEFLEWHQ